MPEEKKDKKIPRRIQVAINQLTAQRENALAKRRVLDQEIEALDHALLPLMGPEE